MNEKNTQKMPNSLSGLPSERSAILRVFGRNTLWLWIDLGALRMGTMLAGFFLIRYFGPENFGIYSTALGIGWLANAAVDLGLTRYAARAVAANYQEGTPILTLSLSTTAISIAGEIVFLMWALTQNHYHLACITAGLILCNLEGTAGLCSTIMTAELRSRAILPGSVISAASMIALTILVVTLHWSVLTMLLGVSIKSLVVLALRLWQLRTFWPSHGDWSTSHFRRVVRRAWPFFSYNMTQVGYSKIAIVFFGLTALPEKVGWFAAAFTISDIIPQWSYASCGALLPLWTRLFESNRMEELVDLRQKVLDLIVFLAVPVGVALAIFAPEICHFLGAKFANSVVVLRIVAYRSLLSVLDGFLGHGFLIAINRIKERQVAQARSAILLGILTLGLGYMAGGVGVAVALFISDATLIYQYLRIAEQSGLKVECPAFWPSVTAGLGMLFVTMELASALDLATRVVVALSTYAVLLVALTPQRLAGAGKTLRESFSG